MLDSLRNGNMTSLCKKAIKWFWLWPVLATVLGYTLAVFGIGGPDFIWPIASYAAPFVGFGILLMAIEKREQMRPFLCMFLVVGLVLNARGFYELAHWGAQGLLTTKIQTEGIPYILHGLPAFVPVFRWTIFTPYAFMTSVPILLPLLITPPLLCSAHLLAVGRPERPVCRVAVENMEMDGSFSTRMVEEAAPIRAAASR